MLEWSRDAPPLLKPRADGGIQVIEKVRSVVERASKKHGLNVEESQQTTTDVRMIMGPHSETGNTTKALELFHRSWGNEIQKEKRVESSRFPLDLIERHVMQEMADMLTAPFTRVEIERVISRLPMNKATQRSFISNAGL
ncbi:hypothetical protein QJS10_CPA07g00579 [Acorus calamus]|uniref:Uncharacterized protein n=1 Tax=Acorus calamus TaxID=4465 RepID=A0AAV9ED79_ACOCL|nr:hypothetical protein QJS10_CPA07g00579 [Acorus calamus]